jgi:hypothetical protein
MAYVPDPPYPKTAGQIIRSADWNGLVGEAQRLDTAKVNKTGDSMSGPLTIAGALAVGTATGAARLHVVDNVSPAVLRVQSTLSFGAARLEMWSDPQGSGTEWRPGYITSFDAGSFTGGLSFVTNGTGAAQRTGSKEAMRLVNGRVGIGVPSPQFIVDIGDRIRLRQGGADAGIWFFQTGPNADRAFLGMANDNAFGFWSVVTGWALTMDVPTGNCGIRMSPNPSYALAVAGDAYVNGRVRDNRLRLQVAASNQVSISAIDNVTTWVAMPNMSMTVTPAVANYFLIRFYMNGVQMQISNSSAPQGHTEFRLLIDGGQADYTLHEFHNNGWELRGVVLESLIWLNPGSHSVAVQWSVKSPNAGPAVPPFVPERRATLTGCWYGDARRLTAIEL